MLKPSGYKMEALWAGQNSRDRFWTIYRLFFFSHQVFINVFNSIAGFSL
jgi:hypothetical protein